jgi:hypothetical protein
MAAFFPAGGVGVAASMNNMSITGKSKSSEKIMSRLQSALDNAYRLVAGKFMFVNCTISTPVSANAFNICTVLQDAHRSSATIATNDGRPG